MSDVTTDLCVCSTCGFEWERGTHDTHICSQVLHAEVIKLRLRIIELEKELKEMNDREDARDYKD
jgi:hypothetical protein